MDRILLLLTLLALSHSPARAVTLRLHLPATPVSLDWNGVSTMIEAPIVLAIQEGLYRQESESGEPVPALAESVTKEKGDTLYTFKIRKDAKWSDGRRVYAKDFADAWLRLLAPRSPSIYIYYLFDIENAREFNSGKVQDPSEVGIRALDDHTLRVKLKRPARHWERNTAFWPLFPVRSDLIEKYGANWWRAGVLVTTGPFVWDSYEPGRSAVLVRNPHHSVDAGSNVSRIEVQFLSDYSEALTKFEKGEFPFLWNLPSHLLKNVKAKGVVRRQSLMRGHLLALNAARYPMTNRDFRAAILHSFDPAQLIPAGTDHLKTFRSLILPPLPGSEKPRALKKDVKEARARLKKSGFITGGKFKLRIMTGMAEPHLTIARNLQSEISESLGIPVEVDTLPGQEYTAYRNLGEYHATLITWTAKVLSPQDFLLPYSGEAAYNSMNYRNPFFDQYLFEGVRAKNREAQARSFSEAQKLLCEDEAVASPLYQETATHLQQKGVRGLHFNPMGIPLLDRIRL